MAYFHGNCILLYYVYRQSSEENAHERYLEYLVLAESLRIQYFISKAGIEKQAIDILPWFSEIRIPLVKNVLRELPSIKTNKKELILGCWIRAGLKIRVGTTTAITIFLSNYYGKMSLSSKVKEHLRMRWLYEKVEREIRQTKEESEELILYLARECLIENTIWYSHQKKNTPDFAVE